MGTYDVIVLGVGPGGEEVATQLAEAGLSVLAIDGGLVGGECPYWGCIPSKMIIRAANSLAESRRVNVLAGTASVEPSWAPVAARIRMEATDNWDDMVAVRRLEGHGVTFLRGWGTIRSSHEVEVDGQVQTASRALVIDVGASPWAPPIEGLAGVTYWTNREAIEAVELPSSLLILGGGAIGVELAQGFARFGVDVTIVEVGPRLLVLEEPEAGRVIEEVLTAEGITVHSGAGVSKVSEDVDGHVTLHMDDRADLSGDRLLVATGRRPDLDRLGAASLGIDPKARALPTEPTMRVTEGVWAIGDVTGRGAFTHMSMIEARIAIADILGTPQPAVRFEVVPRVTFTDPEVGSVGLSEDQARAAGIDVAVARVDNSSTSRGFIHKYGAEGFVKLVADVGRVDPVLVGATSVGPAGGEILGMLTLAVHAEIPLRTLGSMIYAYPTFHRGITEAVRQLLS